MTSKSAKYYQTHPEARRKKKEYDTEFNRKPEQRKKRSELVMHNREHDEKYGKKSREGKDASHTSDGKIVYKSSSTNRGSKSDTGGDKKARGKRRKKQ